MNGLAAREENASVGLLKAAANDTKL